MRGTNDGEEPELLARLPTDVSSDNDLLIKDGYIYLVSSDNKQLYRVAMKRKNLVFKEPLKDTSIQQVSIFSRSTVLYNSFKQFSMISSRAEDRDRYAIC